MRVTPASERVLVWQLSDQLRLEVRKLTRSEAMDSDHRLRSQIEDAATEIGHNIEKALATDHAGEFGRFVRLSRSALTDVQSGLRIALMKRRVTQSELRDVEELLSRLYPALSSLLATRSSGAIGV